MKILFVFLFGCIYFVQNGLADDDTDAGTAADPPAETTEFCTTAGISCYNCTTLQSCSATGAKNLEYTVSCEVQNPNRPYCDKDKVECVADDVCDPTAEKTVECYNNGTRPDPENCSRYVKCVPNKDKTGFIGLIVKCPSGTQFNIAQGKCVSNYRCQTIASYCTAYKAGKLVTYTPYPSLYAKCPAANSNGSVIVKLCKGEYVFNEQSAACEPICRKEGFIANNLKCNEYYNCVKVSSGGYSMTSNVCPPSTSFNPVINDCDASIETCIPVGRSLLLRRKRDLLDLLTISGY